MNVLFAPARMEAELVESADMFMPVLLGIELGRHPNVAGQQPSAFTPYTPVMLPELATLTEMFPVVLPAVHGCCMAATLPMAGCP